MVDNNYKKALLQRLISMAMSGPAAGNIHAAISGLKNAMGMFKNFAKEWDGLNGIMGSKQQGQEGQGMLPFDQSMMLKRRMLQNRQISRETMPTMPMAPTPPGDEVPPRMMPMQQRQNPILGPD